MKVRMRSTMAGPKGVYQADQIVDLPEAQAEDLIKRGYASRVAPAPAAAKRETAAARGPSESRGKK